MLNLTKLPHPHTGTELSVAVDKCLREWNIEKSMILMTVTDNGSNMIKAIKILKELKMKHKKPVMKLKTTMMMQLTTVSTQIHKMILQMILILRIMSGMLLMTIQILSLMIMKRMRMKV